MLRGAGCGCRRVCRRRGNAVGAGIQGGRKHGSPKPQAGPFQIFLWVPCLVCFFSPFLYNPSPHTHTHLSPRICPRQSVLPPSPLTPPGSLGRFCFFICHFPSLHYAPQGCFRIAPGLSHSLEASSQSYKLHSIYPHEIDPI